MSLSVVVHNSNIIKRCW